MRIGTRRSLVFISVLAFTALAASPVARGAPPPAWQQVGDPVAQSDQPFVGYDLKRIGGTAYIAWSEEVDGVDTLRVARFDGDSGAWVQVGPTVNHDPTKDATYPSLAAGPGDVPWLAWKELDSHGIGQLRAAHLSGVGDAWIEPDPRDFAINQLPTNWTESGAVSWGGIRAVLVFLGERPYIAAFTNGGPTAPDINWVRLADSGDSWQTIPGGYFEDPAQGVRAGVLDGLLHAAGNSYDSAWLVRINQNGQYETLVNTRLKVDPPCGGSTSGETFIHAMAALDGAAHILWNTTGDPNCDSSMHELAYVSRFVDGAWQVVGGGPFLNARGRSLRVIGGRLYAAWLGVPGEILHVSRPAADGNSWVSEPDPMRIAGDGDAILSAIGGVPYLATNDLNGSTHRLLVEKLTGAADPIGPDDGEGSGPGTDPDVAPLPGWHALDFGGCGWVIDGTSQSDRITGFSNERNNVHGRGNDDTLTGSTADDCLSGDFGPDRLDGDVGDDLLRGGGGTDVETAGDGQDAVIGNDGDDILRGGPGHDHLRGNRGDDRINADDGRHDWIDCGAGDDTVYADARDDVTSNCEDVRLLRGPSL
jgi:hypothetical protein